jgi:serine/threonine protein kinase
MFVFSKKKKELNISEILKGKLVCQKCEKSFPLENLPPLTLSKCPYCQDYNFIPKLVKRYCIFKPLGGGGGGCVYKVYDLEKNRYVAIKTLQESENSKDAAVFLRFLKEYAIGKKVSTHPNFCRTYDFFELNSYSYMVLEFVEGNRLDKIISPENLPELKLVVLWGLQILSALQHMYRFDYLYRDLKPQNILITDKGKNVKIIDFGLSCKKEETGIKTGIIEGSPEFNVTPERSNFATEDMYSEIYGLGMLMFFCLTGKTFYNALTVKELVNLHNRPLRVSDLSQKMVYIHSGIAVVIDKMIKNDPSERFQTYKEVCQALEAVKI